MQLQKASRKKARIKMALQGPAGSGKTMSALLAAYGLCGDWTKIAVIDTENHSASLYAHLGEFYTVHISPPFTPEKYIEAVKYCEREDITVVIIDSISHEWDGIGGILDIHSAMLGNSFTNWSKVTPRHNAFVQTLLQSSCHIIGTIRSKQDYVLSEKNGKMVPEKVGLKGVQRDGIDYEFTVVFDIDIKHQATASKDRTGLFDDKPAFIISSETGEVILQWCEQGEDITPDVIGITSAVISDQFLKRINDCISVPELLSLFQNSPEQREAYQEQFTRRRKELMNGKQIHH
jgi:hypothetical protein